MATPDQSNPSPAESAAPSSSSRRPLPLPAWVVEEARQAGPKPRILKTAPTTLPPVECLMHTPLLTIAGVESSISLEEWAQIASPFGASAIFHLSDNYVGMAIPDAQDLRHAFSDFSLDDALRNKVECGSGFPLFATWLPTVQGGVRPASALSAILADPTKFLPINDDLKAALG